VTCYHYTPKVSYSGKVWWGENLGNLANHPWFAKLKPSKFLLTILTFWLNLFICQTFFCQMIKMNKFAKLSPCQTFLLYGTLLLRIITHGLKQGITRPNMTQQVSRAQHGPTYNGPIYLYRLSILSGRVQQTFSRACALL